MKKKPKKFSHKGEKYILNKDKKNKTIYFERVSDYYPPYVKEDEQEYLRKKYKKSELLQNVGAALIIVANLSIHVPRFYQAFHDNVSLNTVDRANSAKFLSIVDNRSLSDFTDNATWSFDIHNAIEDAIDKNNNLNASEKFFLKEYAWNYCGTVGEYVQYNKILSLLETLKFKYEPDFSEKYLYKARYAAADYSIITNTINFYCGVDIIDIVKNNRDAFEHEIRHVLSYELWNKLGRCLEEGMTAKIGIENGREYAYSFERMAAGMMCELLSPEEMMYWYENNDTHHLINSLTNIIDDRNLATQLLISLDESVLLNYDMIKGQYDKNNGKETRYSKNIDNIGEKIDQKQREFFSLYNCYYYYKYHKNIQENVYLQACFDYMYGTKDLELITDDNHFDDHVLRIVSVDKNHYNDSIVNNRNTFKIGYLFDDGHTEEFEVEVVENELGQQEGILCVDNELKSSKTK